MIFLGGLAVAAAMCFIAAGFFVGFKLSDWIDREPYGFYAYFFTVFAWFGLTGQIIYWIFQYFN